MIIFKKQTGGRLTVVQRNLVNDVNALIRGLPTKEKKRFKDLVVNNEKDLQNLYKELSTGNVDFELKPQNKDSLKPIDNPAPKETIVEPISNPMSKTNVEEVPDFFSPLSAPAKERSYSHIETVGGMEEIPEPVFNNSLSPEESSGTLPSSENGGSENYKASHNPTPQMEADEPKGFSGVQNEALNDLDAKEKRQATKQLVDTVLDAYQMAHQFAANYTKMDEGKLMEKVAQGEIDPELTFPIDENGTHTNALEYFQTMNAQVDEALSYDPEFGEKVKPALQRVFEKKGWGFTDEQYLMYMFGKDIAVKTTLVISLKKSQNMMLNMFAQMKQTQIAQQVAAEKNISSVRPDAITHPPKNDEPQDIPLTPMTPEEIEDAMIEEEH